MSEIKLLFLIGMIFCHIVDDYYLQGWLANAKQRAWWKINAPNPLYKYDYLMALFMHSFSWSFMVMLLPTYYVFNSQFATDYGLIAMQVIAMFIVNLIIHFETDNAKANLGKINLIQDQTIHMAQIFVTWLYLVVIR